MAIEARHYEETRVRLTEDPIVKAMAEELHAETVNLFDMTLLLTYRSTAVRDDDPAYEDVAHLLERAGKVEKIFEETIPDDLMFFGEATWTVHLLHSGEEIKAPTDPRVQRMVDLIMRWDYAAHPAYLPDRIREQLSMGVA
ncbi:hypothetical protein SEA_CAVIAR_72 [Mycobacterium phage Caviar]|nr:hypothetical protein SEA_CAVIAR_72 [Mycobacterium phage Caviar]